MSRIYLVKDTEDNATLVRAETKAQARRAIAERQYPYCEVATQDDLVELAGKAQVIVAGDENDDAQGWLDL